MLRLAGRPVGNAVSFTFSQLPGCWCHVWTIKNAIFFRDTQILQLFLLLINNVWCFLMLNEPSAISLLFSQTSTWILKIIHNLCYQKNLINFSINQLSHLSLDFKLPPSEFPSLILKLTLYAALPETLFCDFFFLNTCFDMNHTSIHPIRTNVHPFELFSSMSAPTLYPSWGVKTGPQIELALHIHKLFRPPPFKAGARSWHPDHPALIRAINESEWRGDEEEEEEELNKWGMWLCPLGGGAGGGGGGLLP